jgi:hypothetical protein
VPCFRAFLLPLGGPPAASCTSKMLVALARRSLARCSPLRFDSASSVADGRVRIATPITPKPTSNIPGGDAAHFLHDGLHARSIASRCMAISRPLYLNVSFIIETRCAEPQTRRRGVDHPASRAVSASGLTSATGGQGTGVNLSDRRARNIARTRSRFAMTASLTTGKSSFTARR